MLFNESYVEKAKKNNDHCLKGLFENILDYEITYFKPLRDFYNNYPKNKTDLKELKHQLESENLAQHDSAISELIFYDFCLMKNIPLTPINKSKTSSLDFKLKTLEQTIFFDVKTLFTSEKGDKNSKKKHTDQGEIKFLSKHHDKFDVERIISNLSENGSYTKQLNKAKLQDKTLAGIILFNLSYSQRNSFSTAVYNTEKLLKSKLNEKPISFDFVIYSTWDWSEENGFYTKRDQTKIFYKKNAEYVKKVFNFFSSSLIKSA